jgi:hypothetical protein
MTRGRHYIMLMLRMLICLRGSRRARSAWECDRHWCAGRTGCTGRSTSASTSGSSTTLRLLHNGLYNLACGVGDDVDKRTKSIVFVSRLGETLADLLDSTRNLCHVLL